MASLSKTYDRKKLLGQVYTPSHIVEKILAETDFYKNVATVSVLDPACGDGRFLVPVVRYMVMHLPKEQLADALHRVHGWDIDREALDECRANLNEEIASTGLTIDWKLDRKDALRQRSSRKRYDLILGNPPYIRIQHLPESQRKYIQKHYQFCRLGATDIYLAFFEVATALLSRDGICGLITPNSWLSSEAAESLRNFFWAERNLRHITNYGTLQLFDNLGTYTAITVFGKQPSSAICFEKYGSNYRPTSRLFGHDELPRSGPWTLSVGYNPVSNGVRLGEICQISVGISTLADHIFLFSIVRTDGVRVRVSNREGHRYWLDAAMLKPVVKGSKLKSSDDLSDEFILFPYKKDLDGTYKIIPEHDLRTLFPDTYRYLCAMKPQLDRRDNGRPNPAAWYAFGRAQSLNSCFGSKIVFSPISKTPNFIRYENPDCMVYSGYFIKFDGDNQWLLSHLNSPAMADYIEAAGRDFSGGYKGYNKKILENFILPAPSNNEYGDESAASHS